MALSCAREVEVDLGILSRASGLKPGAFVAFVPTWWSDGTSLRGQGEPVFLQLGTEAGRRRIELEFVVPGAEVAHHLQLKTSLVLGTATPAMAHDRLAPRRESSVLWEDSITVILESDAPRFPMSVVDFVENGIGPANACWRFEWSTAELALPAMATMRLLVNARHNEFRQALVTTAPTEAQLAIRSALKHALAIEMLHLGIPHAAELEAGLPHEAGSAGRVLVDLMARVLPGHTPISCAELLRSDPARFGVEVQARLGLFSEAALRGGDA